MFFFTHLFMGSSVFEEGPEILAPFQTPVGRVGLLICFDVRTKSFRFP
jgi:predicted amidohydrolase